MIDKLVTYHIHKCDPLPANDALAYQYVLAGNGVFVRAETRFFKALLPVTACTVRGLLPLHPQFQLLVPRIPARLLDVVLADARCARRPDNGLNEVLYQFHHHGRAVQVKKPTQQTTPTSVTTSVKTAVSGSASQYPYTPTRSRISGSLSSLPITAYRRAPCSSALSVWLKKARMLP